MSLEEQLAANTAALKELTAALLAGGVLQNAQAMTTPAVQAVVKAQKAADEANRKANPKGGEHESSDAAAQEQSRTASALAAAKKHAAQEAAEAARSASGEPSAPTGESSSNEPTGELQPWHEKTATLYGELKDGKPTLDNLRKAVLGINGMIGRDQAEGILQRFGAQAITPKDTKKGLDEAQYPDAFALCLDVLSGRVDATASMVSE
ncbi:hypothetical protein [Paraburkholderia sp. BL21I4N1]|uniref:hypothetical protein n=1 Tax=Paraburkholderia sp. BL21I4N1 TaxID=1938801 RepID=UPI000CFD335B|nr:hypothetical protein [Paraburkholderia sp. BL21I4N1]PQV51845.1 hypothetical protein B0G83_10454 [Paraburkholderia sp. BL21I4N1]